MPISKGAHLPDAFRRPITPTMNARTAIRLFVESLDLARPPRVLVPAYYGFSVNEGSGVLDPLEEVDAIVGTYPIDRELHVEPAGYERKLSDFRPDLVMLIHYFGWPDPRAEWLAKLAHTSGAKVLEDEAHSLLTDFVGGVCGRWGNAAAISLHKSLPVSTGGLLVVNPEPIEGKPDILHRDEDSPLIVSDFDLATIARRRVGNARTVLEEVREIKGTRPLWGEIPSGVVPLNLPILVAPRHRQLVYEEMNGSGFGVVSLYHRLGGGIERSEHPNSYWLSERLVNIPVHQDISEDQIPPMMHRLAEILRS